MWLGSQATPGAEVGLILMPITPAERRGHYLGADVALAPSHKGHLQSHVILQNPGVKPITRISRVFCVHRAACLAAAISVAPAAPMSALEAEPLPPPHADLFAPSQVLGPGLGREGGRPEGTLLNGSGVKIS